MTAAESDVLRWGSTLDWAIWLTVGLSGLILVCIIASWIVFREHQTEGSALWLHLLALGIFPLFLMLVGNFAVLEYAKEERFCGTCHLTMKPYVDDLHRPQGKSLAALHFQHRFAPGTDCYTCHANYGLHGTFEAKMTGLRHVYKYATRTFRLPLTMPAPFENTLCLKCHDGAKRFVAEAIHLDGNTVSAELRTGQTECIQCHGPAHDTPKPKRARGPGEVG